MRARFLSGIAVACVACAGAGPNVEAPQKDELPPPPGLASSSASAASSPVTKDCGEDFADTPPKPKTAVAPSAKKDLGLLLPSKAPPSKPVAKRSDLGRVAIRLPECVLPRAELDMSSMEMPASVPRADLPPPIQQAWDKRAEAKQATLDTLVRAVKIDAKRTVCERTRCAKLACLVDLYATTLTAAKTQKKELADLEEGLVRQLEKAPSNAGTDLALGLLRDRAVRRGEGDPTKELGPAIASLEAAKAKAPPSTEIGWFARYLLAGAYGDVGKPKEAKAEWVALASAPPRGRGTAEAHFRVGERETDPVRAAEAFTRAASALTSDEEKPLRAPFTFKQLRAEVSAGRWVDAIHTGVALLDLVRGEEDNGFASDAIDEIAFALDALGEATTGLPSLPEHEWTKVGAAVAREALARFDPASAAITQKAIGIAAPTTQPPTDVAMRARAVARSCGFLAFGGDGGEIELRVEAMAEGRAKVTAKKKTGDAQVDGAVACLVQRAPGYFVGSPASASATIVYLPK